MKSKTGRLFLILIVSAFIFNCGGGGGGGGVDVDEEGATPPPAPTGLTATAVSASRIDLSWHASANAVGYNVYRNDNKLAIANVFNTTSYSDSNLTPRTPYTYTVRAYNSNGNESDPSNQAGATTLGTATILSGTTSNDYGRGVAVDGSGNIFVTGWTGGNLDGNTNTGHAEVFLTKYDSKGIRQWTKLLGTTGVSGPNPDALLDALGNGLNVAVDGSYVYVTGYTTGGIDGAGAIGGKDIFLVRYDKSNGSGKLSKIMGTVSDDAGNSVAVDTSGNVYVTGYTEGEIGGAGSHKGGKDVILIKCNSSLVPQWARQIGSTGDDVATAVAVSASGNKVAITGQAGGPFVSFSSEPGWGFSGGVSDLFVARYDSAGNNGSLVFRGSGDVNKATKTTAGLSIAIYQDSYVAVTGITNGEFGASNQGGYDIVVAYLNLSNFTDSNGRWNKQIGTALDDIAYGITMDSDPGNVYVTGFTWGTLPPFFVNKGEEDILLARFGLSGTLFSVTLAGTAGDEKGKAIAFDANNDYLYIAGFTNASLDGITNFGAYDMCLLKFDLSGVQQ
jgi:chitodextrinase